MKSLIWVVAVICLAATSTHAYTQVHPVYANIEVKNTNGDPMLLGCCEVSLLKQNVYKQWFEPAFTNYQPDSVYIRQIQPLLANKTIEIFLGTWCGDSRREVPRMLKILESAGMSTEKVKLIFVSNAPEMYKQSPQHEEQGKNIKRVPTLIIYSKQQEIGRIIEYPVETLEKDLLKILIRENYVPNYSGM